MIVLVLLWVVCAGFAGVIAHNKGRSVGGFVIAGLLLGVVGLLWAAFARSADDFARERREALDDARAEALKRQRPSRLGGAPPMRWPE